MGSTFTILIADRNGNIREFLKREFSALGYRVELARDHDELKVQLQGEHPPDLVIMEILLPFADGLGIIEELHQGFSELPVIVYSSMTEYEKESLAKGAAAFIEKEGAIENLTAMVSSLLEANERS